VLVLVLMPPARSPTPPPIPSPHVIENALAVVVDGVAEALAVQLV
jgi:hypothetical protein